MINLSFVTCPECFESSFLKAPFASKTDYNTICPDRTASPPPYPQVHLTGVIIKLTIFVQQIDGLFTSQS